MKIAKSIREAVRFRAAYACEFCGVSETDTGGELTIDHYIPQIKGGTNDFENLLYCCSRCNLYKHDYFPSNSHEPILWNPRIEPASFHFIELEIGALQPLTPTGVFTIQRMRLNRPQLVEYRLSKRKIAELTVLFERYAEMLSLLEKVNLQLSNISSEQQRLLEEQQRILKILIR
jgi:hypothetical protein